PRSSGPPAACTSRRVPATTVPVTSTAGVLGDRLGVHHLVLLRNITDYCMNGRVQFWVMGVWRWLGDGAGWALAARRARSTREGRRAEYRRGMRFASRFWPLPSTSWR